MAKFPEFCFWAAHTLASTDDSASPASLYIGLSRGGKLHVASGDASRTLATNANSFTVTPGFLIFTTTAHVAQFAPLKTLGALLASPETPLPEFESRRVERGSRIVTAVPSTMSLVLQMPRGNLETINPRPLVMEIVRQDIDRYAPRLVTPAFAQRLTRAQWKLRQGVCCVPEAPRRLQRFCRAR